MQKLRKGKACRTFPSLEREGDRRTSVESRTLYVRAKESVLMALSALSIKEAIRRIHALCSPRNTPTRLLILSANPNSEGIGRPRNPGRISADHERQLIFI